MRTKKELERAIAFMESFIRGGIKTGAPDYVLAISYAQLSALEWVNGEDGLFAELLARSAARKARSN